MKQWIARNARFGALSLAVVIGFATQAQMIEIEEPAQGANDGSAEAFQGESTTAAGPAQVLSNSSTESVNDAASQAESNQVEERMATKKLIAQPAPVVAAPVAPVAAPLQKVESQPVALSSAMQPAIIPPAPMQGQSTQNLQAASATQGNGVAASNLNAPANAGAAGFEVPGLPSAGNLNHNSGSGQQIIIVPNLQNSPNTVQDQGTNVEAKNSTTADLNVESMSRSELLRRERMRGELQNESRILERLEEGRISDERARAGEIERFETSVQGSASATSGLESVPVVSADAAAAATASGNNATAVAVASSSVGSPLLASANESASRIRLAPFGGYRWFENNNSEFRAKNDFVTGVNLEGQINDYIGVEGSFSYARDSYTQNYGYGGVPYYSQFNMYGPQGNYYPSQCASCAVGGGGWNPNSAYNYPVAQSRDTFDVSAGLKLGYSIEKVRPFVAASIGGIFQKYAIDDRYTESYLESIGWNRSTNYVISNLGGGLDFNVAKNFAIGARFDYQAFLNKKATEFNRIWGDSRNRYRLTGSLQVMF